MDFKPTHNKLKNQDPIIQQIFRSFMEYVEKNVASCNIYSNDGYKINLKKVRLLLLLCSHECQIFIIREFFRNF